MSNFMMAIETHNRADSVIGNSLVDTLLFNISIEQVFLALWAFSFLNLSSLYFFSIRARLFLKAHLND